MRGITFVASEVAGTVDHIMITAIACYTSVGCFVAAVRPQLKSGTIFVHVYVVYIYILYGYRQYI